MMENGAWFGCRKRDWIYLGREVEEREREREGCCAM
jgi:hypothetical protein